MKHLIAALLVLSANVCAIPQLINYQGQLNSPSGTPLDTTVAMTFTIYDAPAVGLVLWTETHPAVDVSGGLFQVSLGSISTLTDQFSVNSWLGLTVGTNSEMTPRQQIESVAHAYRVGTIDGANGGNIAGNINVAGKGNFGFGNTNVGTFAFVAGQNNTALGANSAVGGGIYNKARGNYAVVVGGGSGTEADSNSATGNSTFIGGGRRNVASGTVATIGGGEGNVSSASRSTVGGGIRNSASNLQSTVSGGEDNTASGSHAFVGGGGFNFARGAFAVISGGGGDLAADSNNASGIASVVVGGNGNTASGDYATISGGLHNIASGQFSLAAGRNANASDEGSFVWGCGPTTTASWGTNTFTARAFGGARFYSSVGDAGVVLSSGAGSWSSLSDSTQKRNRRAVNTKQVLEKVCVLPVQQWSYKAQAPAIEHIGPMAQDFYALFNLGESDTMISTIDPDGVALAAIQELAKQNAEIVKVNELQSQEIAELKQLVRQLVQLGNK